MKVLLYVLLAISLALNVAFLSGCVSVGGNGGSNPASTLPPPDDARARLVRIASLLDIPTDGKQASDLEGDIRYKLNHDKVVPAPYDEAAFEKMTQKVGAKDAEAMREYHQFIRELQGKRVIVVGGDD